MVYDGSASNSPTSVRTPDNDSFEDLMLDSHSLRDFYQGSGGTMATQVSQASVTAVDDNNMFLTAQGTISNRGMHSIYFVVCFFN